MIDANCTWPTNIANTDTVQDNKDFNAGGGARRQPLHRYARRQPLHRYAPGAIRSITNHVVPGTS
jgi:hypothetical protein